MPSPPSPTSATPITTKQSISSPDLESDPSTGDTQVFNGFEWVYESVNATAFPSSPRAWREIRRTDLDCPEKFAYDPVRGKWLGELQHWRFSIANTISSAPSLNPFAVAGGVTTSSSRGILIPLPVTVCGMALSSGASMSGQLWFFEGASPIGIFKSFTSQQAFADRTINFDIDGDASTPTKYPLLYLTAGSMNYPILDLLVRTNGSAL